MGARDRLREFFEQNIGKVVTHEQLSEVAQISEWARRVRELRNDEGMQILTHNDRVDLKPGEYILVSLKRLPVTTRDISPQLRNEILLRNGYTCQLCGAGAGDPDPFNPKRKVTLHIDHIIPVSQGGNNNRYNLRVLCSVCNQVKGNIQTPSESALNIIARVRRQPKAVQKEVYEMLKKKFES
jgi:hypothetical protein